MKARARQKSLPVASQMPSGTRVAIDPRIGPASPTRASAAASSPIDFAEITAPMKGMNIGADALIPSRRSWNTCPSSWRSRRSTKPIEKSQPKIS